VRRPGDAFLNHIASQLFHGRDCSRNGENRQECTSVGKTMPKRLVATTPPLPVRVVREVRGNNPSFFPFLTL
jgi:hypothetical protein